MSDASRVQLTYRQESAFGEAPAANVAMTRIRLKNDTLKHANATVISDELRADRQRMDLALVGFSYDGDINFELTYGDFFEPALEAALCGTWGTPSANNLRNGTTNRSFTLEKGWLDLAKYAHARGCCVNTFEVTAASRQIVQCRAGIMGSRGYAAASTSISGTTALTQPGTNAPIRAGSKIAIASAGTSNIELVGVSAKSINFTINNNLRLHELVTQEATDDFGRGVMEITGTIETYFKDIVIYNQFLLNGLFAVRFNLTDPVLATANSYQITFPTLKLSGADIPTPGVEQDIMQALPFRALVDPAVGYAVNVARAVTI